MSVPFRLRVESGPNAGQLFTLDSAGTTIGRQDGNTIVLDDGRLSRQHARIDLGPGGLTLTDLGSANGTRINGQRVSGTQPLHSGDQLQLGETTIVVEGGATAPSAGKAALLVHPAVAATTPIAPMGGETAPRLILESDGRIFRIEQASTVIGRQAGSGITLPDTQASRQHARIEVRSGQLTVTDLGSANGTRVNGTVISAPTTLRDGDQLQIGTSLFRVEARNGSAEEAGSGGATVSSGLPPIAAPPPFGALPRSGTAPLPPLSNPPPPPFAPGASAWGAPAAQFGAPPTPIGQVGMPPPVTPTKRSSMPLILGGLAALVLLLCVGGGVVGALFLRGRADATPTPLVGAVTGTSVIGGGNLLTPTVGTSGGSGGSLPTPTGVAPNFPGGGSSPATFPGGGGGGGNPAPPPPSAAPAPTLAAVPPTTAAAVPRTTPTPLPATRPPLTPTAARPTPTVAARLTQTPPVSGAGRTFTVQAVGLQFVLPANWTQERDEAGIATFLSADKRAQIVVRWSTQTPTGLTAQKLVQDELQRTANEDPAFNVNSVRIGATTFGGQQGYGSDPYSYSLQDGTRLTEADRGVVLTGQAQYFFSFTAIEADFARYRAIFDSVISTVVITGP